jgi:hypothetical protein
MGGSTPVTRSHDQELAGAEEEANNKLDLLVMARAKEEVTVVDPAWRQASPHFVTPRVPQPEPPSSDAAALPHLTREREIIDNK